MACNPKKCNELILCKMVAHDIDPVLGVTLQSNHRFNEHIKVKLQEASKCLYGIKCLRKEGYQQPDVDYAFRSTVLAKLTYGLPVYASAIPELTTVQNFLQRCFKRKYISYQIDIYNVLEEVERHHSRRSAVPGHPLYPSVPETKQSSARLRVPRTQLSRVNTQRFKNSFFNRLFFNIE